MDDRRFDSLAKSFASGASRRSVLKGILGLGGVAIAGGVVLEGDADAAARPTPTPKPVKCPGNQTPVGGVCTCPAGAPYKCNPGTGPACCTDVPGGPPLPTHTECCDNACCHGTCYGEELCCPTNNRTGGLPPTHILCPGSTGPQCFPGNCCDDSDCEDPCLRCDLSSHTCVERCTVPGEVCCGEGDGVVCAPACNGGECCVGGFCDGNGDCCLPPNVGCNGGVCCNGECDGEGNCCPDGNYHCNGGVCCTEVCGRDGSCPPCAQYPGCGDDEICCDEECLSTSEFFTCSADEAGCCSVADACCNVDGCCSGACYGGDSGRDFCCDGVTEVYCQPAVGPAQCCANPATDKCCGTVGCCTSSQCNEEANVCCSEGSFACGVTENNLCCGTETEKCCDGVCIDRDVCCPSTDGDCCVPLTCADVPAYSCPSAFSDGCGQTLDCSNVCPAPQFCNDSGWCDCELGQTCRVNEDCCSTNCCNGTCIADGDTCVSCAPNCACGDGVVDPATDGLACNDGAGVCGCGWCIVPIDGCPCGCDGNPECVRCAGGGICETYNQGVACNGGDGVCIDGYCDACLQLSEPCSVDGQCCGGLCDQGICVTCKLNGGSCDSPADCCSGSCGNGFCFTN